MSSSLDYAAPGNTSLLLLIGKGQTSQFSSLSDPAVRDRLDPFVWVYISFKFLLDFLFLGLSERKTRTFSSYFSLLPSILSWLTVVGFAIP